MDVKNIRETFLNNTHVNPDWFLHCVNEFINPTELEDIGCGSKGFIRCINQSGQCIASIMITPEGFSIMRHPYVNKENPENE